MITRGFGFVYITLTQKQSISRRLEHSEKKLFIKYMAVIETKKVFSLNITLLTLHNEGT